MSYEDDILRKIKDNYELLSGIVQPKGADDEMKVNLSKIESIIQEKIPDALKDYAPEDFYDLYMDFQSVYEKFRDFILYDPLIGKNVVALGGGFSSGKSSFLNALMGKNVLPSGIDPATSVPTYIVRGEKHEVTAINIFDKKVQMQPRDIRKISHGFGILEDDEDNPVTNEVKLGHLLRTIFFSTPLQQYENIAFSDTPGYSKPDSESYSLKTDEETARRQLNSSNYILWFVQADAGTVTEEDIKFIRKLNADIPKLILVSKADKKNLSDLQMIISRIKSNLDVKGIRYVDVFAFSDRLDQIDDEALRDFVESDTEKIRQQIARWNQRVYESNFARSFKHIFAECRRFYETEIDEESRRLTRLNTSITKLSAENIEEEVAEEILMPLNKIVDETRKQITELKEALVKLKELQNEFFTEIKLIADCVGISMPEPSEIDLLQDRIQNPMQLVEQYKKQRGIRTDGSLAEKLEVIFDGMEPVLMNRPGGSKYIGVLADMLQDVCSLKSEEIKINNVYSNLEAYVDLMENI